MRYALTLALVACSSKTDKAPPPTPPPVVRDAAPDAALDLAKPCLPPSLATANVAYLRSDGPRVTVCYGNGDDSPGSVTHCLVLDETGAILGPRTFEDVEKARLAERVLKQPRVTLEEEEEDDSAAAVAYVANHDQTRAFGFRDGKGVFFDLRTNKRIGSYDGGLPDRARPSSDVGARWVGSTHVLIADCAEGAGGIDAPMSASGCGASLVSTSGDSLELTKPDGERSDRYDVIDDELVTVSSGKQIRFIDVNKLREVATVRAEGASSPIGDVRIARFSDRLVVAHARPAGIFFVDRANPEPVSARAIPICR